MIALHHDSYFQCLHQKIEVEKKLSTLMSQEVASTESNVLVKHLQQELRNYVSLLSFLSWILMALFIGIIVVRGHIHWLLDVWLWTNFGSYASGIIINGEESCHYFIDWSGYIEKKLSRLGPLIWVSFFNPVMFMDWDYSYFIF